MIRLNSIAGLLTLAALLAGPQAHASTPETAPTAPVAVPAASTSEQIRALAQPGDVILHQSTSSQSAALIAATGSPYTHVGLLFEHDGALQVLEAVEPVRWTPLDAWVSRGADETAVVLRVPNLDPQAAAAVQRVAERYLGAHYDVLFQWSDDRIYCSELVFKAFSEGAGLQVGALQTFDALDLQSPEVQRLIEARTHGDIDMAETVVTPVSILHDPDLELVFQNDAALERQTL